jgi:hypothetical protein
MDKMPKYKSNAQAGETIARYDSLVPPNRPVERAWKKP